MQSLNYRPEIDGLRALAVISVIFYHANLQYFSGGFIGVDIFFVISGYLITKIIITELKKGKFRLIEFYKRRARRILPALFFITIITIFLSIFFFTPKDFRHLSLSVISVTTFSSNIFFYKTLNYFDNQIERKPLIHTWSLSVEEQFYIFFPIFIIIIWKFYKNNLFAAILIVFFISIFISLLGFKYAPKANFYLLPGRGWEILAGSLLVFIENKYYLINLNEKLKNILAFFGAILIATSILLFDKKTPFPSHFTILPVLGTILLICFANKNKFFLNILGNKLLQNIGKISYSAYLWHQPIFVFLRYNFDKDKINAVLLMPTLSAIFIMAYLTYKYIEQPFRKNKFLKKKITNFSIITFSLLIILGILGCYTNSFESHYLNKLSEKQKLIYKLIKKDTGKDLTKNITDNKDCNFSSNIINNNFTNKFLKCYDKYGKAIIVLGDSHAINIFNILAKTKEKKFLIGLLKPECRPHDDYKNCQYQDTKKFIDQYKEKVELVIFHQSGYYLFSNDAATMELKFNAYEKPILNYKNVEKVDNYLNTISKNTKIIFLGPFLEAQIDFNSLKKIDEGLTISEKVIFNFKKLDYELKKFYSEKNNSKYVSFIDIIKFDKNFILQENCITFNDFDHLSSCGEDIIAKKISFSKIINK